MRAILYSLMTAALMALFAGGALAQTPARHVAIALVAETATPAAGTTVTLAFDSRPAPGWHAYWRNPGDAGVPSRARWTLPAGLRAGELRYPVPGRLLISGLMNYVYEAPFAQLVDVAIPAGVARGTRLPIRVIFDYLVCTTTICVPETQTLATDLTIGDGAIGPATRARFDAWRQALPRPLGSTAIWATGDGRFRLSVPYPGDAAGGDAYFYPYATGAIDYAAPQAASRDGDRLVIETRAATNPASGRIAGVLAIGNRGLEVAAAPGVVVPAAKSGWQAAALAVLGAILGGLLLNAMPCVFPILSLKALSLARANAEPAAARREALAYATGVMLTCVALGGVLLAIRAGGSAAGWAFQLQDPRAIGVLLLLTFAIALNLAGLFEVPTPSFARQGGTRGAFATGALAAFVATPCSGPFMGAALGAALVLPAAAALLVFAGLGMGIALPFLCIGFVPALRRSLPRPGPWLATFRQLLALPMLATALALAWVLGRQAGVDGMAIGLAAASVAAIALWWLGRRQRAGRPGGAVLAGVMLALTLVALIRPAPVTARGAAPSLAGAEPFSERRLAELRAGGRPVFAYFTADWCLTCKVNEASAIDTATTEQAFRRGNVAVLVGDWTNGDAALGRFIESHGRAGVPLYLWYPAGAATPRVLPQILSAPALAALPAGARAR